MKKSRLFKVLGGVTIGVAAVAAAPFTGGGSILAGASALGLGTAAAAGAAVAAGAAGGGLATIFSKDKKPLVKKGLFILGMQNSGKTTIYDFLRGEKKAGVTTNIDDYNEFTYSFNSTESIVIRKGVDTGGDPAIFGRYYSRMIENKNIDFCFFVFNSFKYVNEEEYRREVNARLHSIYEKGILNKKTAIIGSFKDHFGQEKMYSIHNKITQLTSDKSYSILLSREFFHLVDLTNESKIKKFIETTMIK
jgi:hypothetical protein